LKKSAVEEKLIVTFLRSGGGVALLGCQRPAKRALERDEEKIEGWKKKALA
jgi:hypothetical protein